MVTSLPRRNPFSAQGVSQYPPLAPLVGQPRVLGALQELLADLRDGEGGAFCVVYGDWGIGKTRLAHELVAEVTGKSAGWLAGDEAPRALLRPLAEDGVLTVFCTLIDVVKAPTEGLYREEALAKCARVALRGLCNPSTLSGFAVEMANDTRRALDALGATDWDALAYQLDDDLADPAAALAALREATGGAVQRLLIIVDEVETPHEIQSAATPEQRRSDWPLDETSIQVLFSDMKAAAGEPLMHDIGFLFLCSPGVRAAAGELPALQRRLRSATLTRASGDDLQTLMRALSAAGYGLDYPGRLLEAAFLAADRNFGWFSYLMSPIYRELAAPGAGPQTDYGLLQRVAGRVGKIFRPTLIEERELPPEQKEALRRLAYHQLPATAAELGVSEDALQALCTTADPYGDPLAAQVGAARLTVDGLIRGLVARSYLLESDNSTRLVGEGSQPFDPSDLVARFGTFRAGPELVWYYQEPAEFSRQIGLLTADFPGELSDATRATLLALLQAHTTPEPPRIAPSMALLLRFNERWAVANQGVWLEAGAFRRTEDRLRGLSTAERHRRLCLGAAYLALRASARIEPAVHGEPSSPVLVFDLASGDPLALSTRRNVVVAYNHDPASLRETLAALPETTRGAVLVIHPDVARRDRLHALLAGEAFADLAANLVERLLEPGGREAELCLRYGFLDETFRKDDVRERGRTQRAESEREWQSAIDGWKTRQERAGRLLRPAGATQAVTAFRPVYTRLLREPAAFDEESGAVRSDRRLRDGYEGMLAQVRGGGTLGLLDALGNANVPPIFSRLLALTREAATLAALAEQLLYDRGSRADVTFPENPQIAVRQVLQLLADLGLVTETSAGWEAVNGPRLAAELQQADSRLAGMIGRVEALPPDYAALASDLQIDSASLRALRERIAAAVPAAAALDPASTCSATIAAAERAALLNQIAEYHDLALAVGDPTADDEPEAAAGGEAEIQQDERYASYSVATRLRRIAARQRSDQDAAQARTVQIEAARTAVSRLARGTDGPALPAAPALAAIEAAGRSADPTAALQQVESRMREARAALDELAERRREAEPHWTAILDYLLPADDMEQFLSTPALQRTQALQRHLADVPRYLADEHPGGTLTDLEAAVRSLQAEFDEVDAALTRAREAARLEVAHRLMDAPVAIVRRAAERLGRGDQAALLGDDAVWQAGTRPEQLAAVATLAARARAIGVALCGGDDALFDAFHGIAAALGSERERTLGRELRTQGALLDRLEALGLLRWHVAIEL